MASHWLEVLANAAVLVFVGLANCFLARNNRPPEAADPSTTDDEESEADTVCSSSDATDPGHGWPVSISLGKTFTDSVLVGADTVCSSSDATDPGHEFEVFLSFRGTDTRKTFTDHLYNALVDAGFRTFRDNEELHVGKEIGPDLMRAIAQSKISIPIFSKGYASSEWCLIELAEMVRCMEETDGKHTIMPVFFDVTPREVRDQTGAYADSFAQHETTNTLETVQKWRDALAEVGKLKGLELIKAAGGNQGEFIKKVVAEVLGELWKAEGLNEGEIQVGIDTPAKDVLRLLELDNAVDRKMVGMWGMGGIGKTTLAKHVYNRISAKFDGRSFLSDIREKSNPPSGLPQLQKKLISDILGPGKYDIASIDEGISVLKKRLRGKKSLILLDDVDHIDQLKALAGDLRWFGPGSRILVTTRDDGVLQFQECTKSIYEVKQLDDDQALELFYKHAFRNELPRTEFVDLSRDIARTTGGLPLALEVIGSLLFVDRDRVDIWEEKSEEFKKQQPSDVQGKLRISYDALEKNQKKIYLDIACLFIGYDYQKLIPMWDDCGLSPNHGIQVLRRKSLIKIKDGNTLRMHDQLRDLGRHIVEQESEEEPGGCPSRLWREKEAEDVLLKKKGTSKVEAAFTSDSTFHSDCFKNLSNLRILQLSRGAVLAGDFQHLLPNLRWLRWIQPHFSHRLQNVQLDNLVYLDLSYSDVGDDWDVWSSIKMLRLKVLDLSGCLRLRKTPSFSAFPNLERLTLKACSNLVSIDPSVKLLKKLNYLDLEGCSKLENLPNEIAQLEALIELKASQTRIKEISISSIKMGRLKVLHFSHCKELREISSFSSFPNLERLILEGCSNLVSVDESIGLLKNLKHLNLRGWYKLEKLPDQLGHLEALEELYVSAENLSRLPNLSNLRKLSVLCLVKCRMLREIEGLSDLTSLKVLDISGYSAVLDGVDRLSSLRELRIEECDIEALPDLSNLQMLRKIKLTANRNLVDIQGINSLSRLVELSLSRCPAVEHLPLSKLQMLVRLSPAVEHLPLSKLHMLEELELNDCEKLHALEGLQELNSLRKLDIRRCNAIEEPLLLPLRSVLLTVRGCKNLPDKYDPLAEFMPLTKIVISNVDYCSLEEIDFITRSCDGLQSLPSDLQSLTLHKCPLFERLPNLSNFRKLSELKLSDCPMLREIEGISDLTSLEDLYIGGCHSAVFDGVDRLSSLLYLGIQRCDIEALPIGNLSRLVVLTVKRCPAVEHLPLSKLQMLEELKLYDCKKLRTLEGLQDLISLRNLVVKRCKAIEGPLPRPPRLVNLLVRGCKKLQDMDDPLQLQDMGFEY